MQLNSIYLHLSPLPYQLDADASKFFDNFFPGLVELLNNYQDAKIALTLSGFGLEKLQLRKRTGWLEKLAKLSGTQIEILSYPFYDPGIGFFTADRIIDQLNYQAEFWKQFTITPSKSAGVFSAGTFDNNLSSALLNGGITHVIQSSKNLGNKSALSIDEAGLLFSPTTIVEFFNAESLKVPAEQFNLTDRVKLSSECIVPGNFSEAVSGKIIAYLRTLFSQPQQGFLLPNDFAFKESAKEQAKLLTFQKVPSAGYARAELLWSRCHEVPAVIEARMDKAKKENRRGERHGPQEKFLQAKRFLHQASSKELDVAGVPLADRSSTALALHSVVELEAYLRPDVDPTLGWVEKETHGEFELINTQLADYIIDRVGRVVSLDYKPRKISLCSTALQPSFDVSFSIPVTQPPTSTVRTALTRKTKDLCSIRFEETKVTGGNEFKLFRELTFRAGIGAHLPNSTTGFSFEYWLEGDFEEDFNVDVSFSFCLPSPSVESGFIKPLLCVGGVSERRYYLEREKKVDLSELTGGAYGVRIIDSVEDFTMDLRSAKQLEDMVLAPQFSGSVYMGTTCQLRVRASRILEDDHSNTLFISIV